MNAQFGSGAFTFTPTAGNLPANPTPTRLKVLQEASVEFKGDTKKLFGQKQFAVSLQRGKIDITGKLKVASYNANDINQIYLAQALSVGGNRPVIDEVHAPAASVIPSVGSGLLVTEDLGVINGDTGDSMIAVATGTPVAGQYKFTPAVTGGTPAAASYTFAAAETASKVKISYSSTSTAGSTITITSQPMGYAPIGKALLYNQTGQNTGAPKVFALELNAIMCGMMSFPTKQEDFWVSDLDFTAGADASDTVGTLYCD